MLTPEGIIGQALQQSPNPEVSISQETSDEYTSQQFPLAVNPTVGHNFWYLPLKTEPGIRQASQQPPMSLVSGVTHASRHSHISLVALFVHGHHFKIRLLMKKNRKPI